MCGRFTLIASQGEIEGAFEVRLDPRQIVPRYNIAPAQEVLAVTNEGERKAEHLRWGLIPSWANL